MWPPGHASGLISHPPPPVSGRVGHGAPPQSDGGGGGGGGGSPGQSSAYTTRSPGEYCDGRLGQNAPRIAIHKPNTTNRFRRRRFDCRHMTSSLRRNRCNHRSALPDKGYGMLEIVKLENPTSMLFGRELLGTVPTVKPTEPATAAGPEYVPTVCPLINTVKSVPLQITVRWFVSSPLAIPGTSVRGATRTTAPSAPM